MNHSKPRLMSVGGSTRNSPAVTAPPAAAAVTTRRLRQTPITTVNTSVSASVRSAAVFMISLPERPHLTRVDPRRLFAPANARACDTERPDVNAGAIVCACVCCDDRAVRARTDAGGADHVCARYLQLDSQHGRRRAGLRVLS